MSIAGKYSPVVNAPGGAMEGLCDGALRVFKGIPYAEPPLGALRWKPPVPKAHWDGVIKATQFGPACTQPLYTGRRSVQEQP